MATQKITATKAERAILVQRHNTALKAEQAYVTAQQISNDALTLFCHARGIPDGSELVSIEDEFVVLQVPDSPTQEVPKAPA